MTLKELRETAGLRQEDVAKKLNVDQAAVSNWERGITAISRKYHKPLAKLYDVTVEDLPKKEERRKKRNETVD